MAAICARHLAASSSRLASVSLFVVGGSALLTIYTCVDCNSWIWFGPTAVAAATALVLFCSATPPFKIASGSVDPLMFLGSLSYEIYLIHLTVLALAVRLNKAIYISIGWPAFLVVGGATVAVSYLVKTCLADPANDFIRRWKPRLDVRVHHQVAET